jgi:hypothetical protein
MASMIFEEASGIAILTTRVRITANRFGERVWHSSSSNLGYLVERETRTREGKSLSC